MSGNALTDILFHYTVTNQNGVRTMKLKGKKIAYLVGPGFEDLEFWVPFMRLQEEGAEVVTVGLKAGEVYKSNTAVSPPLPM
jgi:hypothetical protein